MVTLALERDELYRRIDARAAEIVEGGAVEEVRRYLQESPATPAVAHAEAGIESAIGFREIRRYLAGEQTREETIVQVAAATRRYARRQSTWLRRLRDAVIIDVRDRAAAAVAEQILALALSGEHTKEPHQL
jgi:tRNA dimethylallyltransferase